MRSRYTAFCQGNIDYLIATLYPAKRQANDVQSLQTTINETDWLGLKVIKAALPKDADNLGFVEFAAFYQRHGFGQLHELSEFIRENGQWYYLQGKLLAPITLKRNELCWCGSGKKYKRCHG
jgi:SEC-C motif-containing protein